MIYNRWLVVWALVMTGACADSETSQCSTSADCAFGEICHNATCIEDFSRQGGGGGGTTVQDGGPTLCRVTADCPDHQYCYLGTAECRDLTPPGCRTDAQCRVGERCEIGEGRSIGTCSGGSSGCLGDEDCGSGERCDDGQCVRLSDGSCTSRQDCPASLSCQEGRCVRLPSRLGQDCDEVQECGSGETCLRVTETDSICTQACGRGDDCPSGFFCYNLAGGRVCIDDRLLQPAATANLRTGDRCVQENAAQVCQSLLCLGEIQTTCRSNCSRDNHCQAGQSCHLFQGLRDDGSAFMVDLCAEPGEFGGRPGRSGPGSFCMGHEECVSGACIENVCRSLCCHSGDCPGGEICSLQSFALDVETTRLATLCLPPQGGTVPGRGQAGSPCRQPTDCRSARCLVADGEEQGFCLDSCCGHSECSGTSVCLTNFLEGPPAALVNLCLP